MAKGDRRIVCDAIHGLWDFCKVKKAHSCWTFTLTLNVTLADFCLLGLKTMRSLMPGDSVAVRRRVSRCLNQVGDALQQGVEGLLV